MEHIFNCHGEWLFAVQALWSLPLVGLWLKTRFARTHAAHTPVVESDE